LLSQFLRLGNFRSGSITAIHGRCGKPYCHCHQPNQPGHSPNCRLTRKVKGKTVSESFSSAVPSSLDRWWARWRCRTGRWLRDTRVQGGPQCPPSPRGLGRSFASAASRPTTSSSPRSRLSVALSLFVAQALMGSLTSHFSAERKSAGNTPTIVKVRLSSGIVCPIALRSAPKCDCQRALLRSNTGAVPAFSSSAVKLPDHRPYPRHGKNVRRNGQATDVLGLSDAGPV